MKFSIFFSAHAPLTFIIKIDSINIRTGGGVGWGENSLVQDILKNYDLLFLSVQNILSNKEDVNGCVENFSKSLCDTLVLRKPIIALSLAVRQTKM